MGADNGRFNMHSPFLFKYIICRDELDAVCAYKNF